MLIVFQSPGRTLGLAYGAMLGFLRHLKERLNAPPPAAQADDKWARIFHLRSQLFDGTYIREAMAQTADGIFHFDVRDNIIGWSIAYDGVWEKAETDFVKSVVQPGDFVVDVGANIGWYTVVLGKLVGENGRVFAFEPESRSYDLLCRNVNENRLVDRCRLFDAALLARAGTYELERAEDNFGDNRIRFRSAPECGNNMYGEESRRTLAVQALTLDEAMQVAGAEHSPIKLIKVDAQGSEVAIFEGAQKTLAQTNVLITEFWPYVLQRAGKNADDFFDAVSAHFNQFARSDCGFEFRSIKGWREDLNVPASTPCGETVYVLKK